MRYTLEPFNGMYRIKDAQIGGYLEWAGNVLYGGRQVQRMNSTPNTAYCSACLKMLTSNERVPYCASCAAFRSTSRK